MESEKSIFVKLTVIEKCNKGKVMKECEEESCLIEINPQSYSVKEIAEMLRLFSCKVSVLINDCLSDAIKRETLVHLNNHSKSQKTCLKKLSKKVLPQDCIPSNFDALLDNPTENEALIDFKNSKATTGTIPQSDPCLSPEEDSEDVSCDTLPCNEDQVNTKTQRLGKITIYDRNETKPSNNSSNESLQSSFQNIVDEFICEICEGKFTTKGSLKRHVKQLHVTNPTKQFKCTKCLRVFQSLYSFTAHKQTHANQLSSGLFGCDICHKQFLKRSSYLVHIRRGGGCGQSTLNCKECGKCFSCEGTLNMHMKRCHTTSNNNLSCQKCHQTFTTKNGLQKHKVKNSCLVDFVCQECHKVFKQANLLKAHLQTHISQNYNAGYQCQKCFRRFATVRGFGYHKKHCSVPTCWVPSKRTSQSNKEISKQYICEICGKHFTQNSSLHKHSRKHSNIRPFPCPSCSKCFFDKFGLKVHERIHTGEKPYLCSQCGKSFVCNSKLKRHMNTHSSQVTRKAVERAEEPSMPKRIPRAKFKKKITDSFNQSPMQNQINPRNELSDFPNRQEQKIKQTSPNPEYTFHEPHIINNYSNMEHQGDNELYYSGVVEMDAPHCLDHIQSGYPGIQASFDSYHYSHPPPPYPTHHYQSDTQYSQHDSVSSSENNYFLLELNSNLAPYDLNNVSEHLGHVS